MEANQTRGENPFSKEALAEYLDAFKQSDTIHSCEDYRAAASIDKHDNRKEKKLLMPILALWAKRGVINLLRCT